MSTVNKHGTVKGIIRGVDDTFPHSLFAEMIDNAEHSKSTKVFVDINVHNKQIIFGFDKPASEEQLDKMVTWNPSSKIHNTSNISTCGAGSKYFGFRYRGQQIHVSRKWDTNQNTYLYMESKIVSDEIYNATISDITEAEFDTILSKNTTWVTTPTDEIIDSTANIFNNKENIFPFTPETVIIFKKISNDKSLEWLNNSENIQNLEKELRIKYHEELKEGKITLFIKFPNSDFKEIIIDSPDIIGSTKMENQHNTYIYYVNELFEKFKIGDFLLEINNIFFSIKPSGNSFLRTKIDIKEEDKSKLILQFKFVQYNISDDENSIKQMKKSIVGTSMEDYCGLYLKIGNKFIDSKPIQSTLTKRNLPGAKLYRGILELQNPEKTKIKLGIHGLKSQFNLNNMITLEPIIKQCCIIYKNFFTNYKNEPFTEINPTLYCEVRTSNKQSDRTSKPGYVYLKKVGKHFWKLGITFPTNSKHRIFDVMSTTDYQELEKDFGEEELFPIGKYRFEYLSCKFDTASSTEQKILENIMQLQDVIIYNNKKGDGIREYFHCENMNTIQEIKNMIDQAVGID